MVQNPSIGKGVSKMRTVRRVSLRIPSCVGVYRAVHHSQGDVAIGDPQSTSQLLNTPTPTGLTRSSRRYPASLSFPSGLARVAGVQQARVRGASRGPRVPPHRRRVPGPDALPRQPARGRGGGGHRQNHPAGGLEAHLFTRRHEHVTPLSDAPAARSPLSRRRSL